MVIGLNSGGGRSGRCRPTDAICRCFSKILNLLITCQTWVVCAWCFSSFVSCWSVHCCSIVIKLMSAINGNGCRMILTIHVRTSQLRLTVANKALAWRSQLVEAQMLVSTHIIIVFRYETTFPFWRAMDWIDVVKNKIVVSLMPLWWWWCWWWWALIIRLLLLRCCVHSVSGCESIQKISDRPTSQWRI